MNGNIIRQEFSSIEFTENRKNLVFCKKHGVRFPDPALGRLRKNPSSNIKTKYQCGVDKIEVEGGFCLAEKLAWVVYGRC